MMMVKFTAEYSRKKSESVSGESNPNNKHSESEVLKYIQLMAKGYTPIELSHMFGIRSDYFRELRSDITTFKKLREQNLESVEAMMDFRGTRATVTVKIVLEVLSTNESKESVMARLKLSEHVYNSVIGI